MSSKGILRVYCSTALGLAGQEFTALEREREREMRFGCLERGMANLMVPVGEGMGETKGDVRVVSILRGWVWVIGEMGGGRGGGISSMREVRASLIWVDGNLMMQL